MMTVTIEGKPITVLHAGELLALADDENTSNPFTWESSAELVELHRARCLELLEYINREDASDDLLYKLAGAGLAVLDVEIAEHRNASKDTLEMLVKKTASIPAYQSAHARLKQIEVK